MKDKLIATINLYTAFLMLVWAVVLLFIRKGSDTSLVLIVVCMDHIYLTYLSWYLEHRDRRP